MTRFLTVLSVLLLSVSMAFAQDDQPAATGGPEATFEETTIDYGTIERGSDPLRKFKFTNTGTEPLIIKNAKGSCGCTVPKYPKEPIMPGEVSYIEVRYDTNRMGRFSKSITLTTNAAEPVSKLFIKGEVLQGAPEQSVPEKSPNMLSPEK